MSTSRRSFLRHAAAAAAAAPLSLAAPHPGSDRRRAHLTDVHVEPEGVAPHGMTRALHAAQRLEDPPELLLNGGDCIMDALGTPKDRVRAQWATWRRTLQAENDLPVLSCIGNHDVWGWSMKEGKPAGDPLYGKAWAVDALEIGHRFYSVDRAGWHFVVLDSSYPAPGGGYTARLDEEQFEWLREDLARTPPAMPVCVLSHIPIIGFCPFFDGDNEQEGHWRVPGAWMHLDARRIKDLFTEHPNVRLALSGRIHLQDRVDYLGVTYLCNGAVSGAWWKGSYQEFPPAFAVVDLYDDGSFDHQLVPYAWT